MIVRNINTQRAPVRQAARLTPDVQVNGAGITSFGSVATARGYSSNSRRMPSAVTLTLNNSAVGAPTLYIIGDPAGIVTSKFNLTAIPATAVVGLSVAAFTASLGFAPLLISGINYSSTSGAVQFAQRFQFGDADVDRGQLTDLVVPQYIRNTSQDPNLLTLRFDEGFELDWNAGFIVMAGANQLVQITLMVGAAAGR